ncbi:MAG: hypothetical protein ACK526_08105 [Planctomyces sp.]|jgi:hypothetical protein
MSSSTTIPETATLSEIAELLHRALQQFDGPQTTAKILGKLPKASRPKGDLAEDVLQREVAEGRLWQYAGTKAKPRYWNLSVAEFARVCLLRQLQGPPQTRADALKALPKATFGELSRFAKEELLDELILAGHVHEWPAVASSGRSKGKTGPLISCQKPDPADFAREAAEKAVAQREIIELLRRALQQFDGPQVTAKILKLLPKASCPDADVAEELFKQEVAEGRLWQYPNAGKKAQFWIQSPIEFARACLIRELQSGPKPETDIIKSVSKLKTLSAVPATAIQKMLSEMLQAGEAHLCPPMVGVKQTKTPPRIISFFKPNPADYVKDALEKVAGALGMPLEDILRTARAFASRELEELELEKQDPASSRTSTTAAGSETQDERLLEAMRTVNPRVDQGDMVDIASLRRELDAHLRGSDFDAAVLDAVYRQRFAIHRYDRPQLITPEARALLLRDEDGNFYNTISLWRN